MKRILTVGIATLFLSGCNSELSLSCATPKGNYLLMIKSGIPWLPLLGPSVKWVASADVHDLKVSRLDDYQVVGELPNRIAGWPAGTERQVFVVNRITSEFHTTFLRRPGAEGAGAAASGDEVVIESIGGTCSRTFPKRI